MTTATLTLTEFLLARIAEDEAEARDWDLPWEENLVQPARVLAECEAKRRIVEDRQRIDRSADDGEWAMGYSDGNYDALHALASIYADHPDYREEWRA